jgi:hypothetical protein
MARQSAPKPASNGNAETDREIQYGCEALTESIQRVSDCQSCPCTIPATVRSVTIRNSPIDNSQNAQLAALAL